MTADSEQQGASDKATIVRAAGLVMALFVVSRALGLLREMVISHQFGTGGDLDAYLAAFRVPDILFQVVAGGRWPQLLSPPLPAPGPRTMRRVHGGWPALSSTWC